MNLLSEIISGTFILILVFLAFKDGGKAFSQSLGAVTDFYTKSVSTLQGNRK